MKLILSPAPIAEYCFLQEALMWIGFNRYPEAAPCGDDEDYRFFHDVQDDYKAQSPCEFPEDLVSSAEATRMGLPRNPEWEDFFGEFGEGIERNPLSHEEQEAAEHTWNEQYKHYIETYEARLFIELRDGHIEAIGRPIPKGSNEACICYDHEPIAKEAWSLDGTDWPASALKCAALTYCHICLNVGQMLKAFPEPEPDETRQVGLIAGQYILGDEPLSIPKKRSTSGRKPYDWDSLYAVVIERIINDDIPEKQEPFIQSMMEWTAKEWGKAAGRSTLLQKLSPFHKLAMHLRQK